MPRHRPSHDRLLEFFRANPSEELTVEDAVAKFGQAISSTKNALGELTSAGKLERVSVYRLKTPE